MFNTISTSTSQLLPVFNRKKAPQQAQKLKFNTGQPATDTITFTSKMKRQDRIAYAQKHQFEQKYGIKPEETISTMINAHRLGLDPRTTTSDMVKAFKLGLDPETADPKTVREEPSRRVYEINAKLMGIDTTGKDLKDLSKAVREKKVQIHQQVVEQVLEKAGRTVSDSYKPLSYSDFSSALPIDASISELLSLTADTLNPKNQALNPIARIMTQDTDLPEVAARTAKRFRTEHNEDEMTAERKAALLNQYKDNELLENEMMALFRAKCVGIQDDTPDMKKVIALEEQQQRLRCKAHKMKRKNFDQALSNL